MTEYIIAFNGEIKDGAQYKYTFGHTRDIEVKVGKQSVVFHFNMTVKKSFEDVVNFTSHIFRDIFRKAYLLHAIKQNAGLKVTNIIITIDGEKRGYTDCDDRFPFVYSLIPDSPLGLGDGWDEDIIDVVLKTTKTKADEDLCFVAMFAFLSAKRHDYKIDEFINLWTSVNAVYSYIANKYREMFESEYLSNTKVNQGNNKLFAFLKKEDSKINMLMELLGTRKGNGTKPSGSGSKINLREELHQLSQTKALNLGTQDEYEQFWKELLDDKCTSEISILSNRYSVTPYGYFAFLLAYNIRCEYIHGSKSIPLLSSHIDYEIYILNAICYVLRKFLDDYILKIIKNEISNEELKKLNNYAASKSNKIRDVLENAQ